MSSAPSPSRPLAPQVKPAALGRVAFLTNILPPYRLPAIRLLVEHCAALRILLSTVVEPNRYWEKEWAEFDVIVQKTITLSRLWRHPQGFEDPLFVHVPLDTFQQLRSFAPNAILSAEMGFRTLLAAIYRRLSKHTVLLIWADVSEATEQGRGRARDLVRRVLKRAADGFIVNGKSGHRYLSRLGVSDDKIFCIPYATDVHHFWCPEVTRTPDLRRKLIYVGQLRKRKGLGPFLAAISRWCLAHSAEVVQLTLLGEGPLRSELTKMRIADNLQLTFSDPVPYRDVRSAYLNAGILVLPTLADTWGLVVNEAMAAGLPVLGSIFSPAVEELVDDNVNGWTFRPDDEDSMRSAIDRCMTTSDTVLEKMRVAAQTSASRFSPEHVATLISSAVQRCVATAYSDADDAGTQARP